MEDNNIREEVVTTEEVVKPKRDYTEALGIGAVAVGAVGIFELGKFGFKKAKKGIVKLAGKIESERAAEESVAEANEPNETTEG